MSFHEPVNTIRLERVIKSFPSLLKGGFLLGKNEDTEKKYYGNLFPILGKFLNKINKINDQVGLAKIEYTKSKLEPKNIIGRLYPRDGVGLICFPRHIRNYLLHDESGKPLVIDLDIKNCHPTLYFQWLLKEGYSLKALQNYLDYIENREEWLNRLGYGIKEEIICVLNCAQKLNSSVNDEKYEKLVQEIWQSHYWIQKKYNLLHLENIKDFIYSKNVEIERIIVDYAMKFIEDNGSKIHIYAYDGFAVDNISDTCLDKLNATIYDATGWNCQFVKKKLDIDEKFLKFIMRETDGSPRTPSLISLEQGKFLNDYITDNLFEDYKEDIFVFKSGMGDGKTWKIYNDLLKLRQKGVSVTSISILNRISLIDNVKFDYPFVYSYREDACTGSIQGVGKSSIVCSESLYRLTEDTLKNCQYLILDEIMSLLPQMICQETHKKNIQVNQEHFIGLVKNAKKVFIMDANVSDKAIDFIKGIRGEQRSVICRWDVAPRRNRKVYITCNILTKLEKSLEEGKKVFIASTRSIKHGEGILEFIRQKFPSLRLAYINSDNKHNYMDLLSDTSKWAKYDVVMISPCISTGVSFTIRDYFDEVFCFFTHTSTNPLDASQQIGRVRYPKTENIYIEINTQGKNPYSKGVKSEEQVLKMLYYNIGDLYASNTNLVDTEFNYDNFKRTLKRTYRTDLFVFNYSEQSFQFNNYQYNLREALKNSYNCEFITDYEDGKTEKENEHRDEVKKFSINYENKICSEILKAENISGTTADNYKHRTQRGEILSEREQREYDKFWLANSSLVNPSGIDELYQAYPNHQPRTIHGFYHKRFPSVVSPLKKYIYNLQGTSLDDDNKIVLSRLFNDVSYNLKDLKETDNITSKFLDDTRKAILVKFIWIEKILKLFGAKFMFQQLSLTNEQFLEGIEKFKKWCKLLVPCGSGVLQNGLSNFNRIVDLFNLKDPKKTNMNLTSKRFNKYIDGKNPTLDIKNIINQCLISVGMRFFCETKQVNKTKVKLSVLYLNLPIILNDYLEPKPVGYITKSKEFWNLTETMLPHLVSTSCDLDTLDEDWYIRYKQSIFYRFRKIKLTEEDDMEIQLDQDTTKEHVSEASET